ncbi:MAG: aminopeptidase P family protein [Promethearchaeota archaeon]|nr:MAG: aminopeptidase P family protein [Candidatus Lokiarchaeota archaeon]
MNKFERAQNLLQDLDIDGWLIACNEDNDVNSRYLLGVASHARHYIFVSAKGNHKVISVEMEAPMIEKSLKQREIDAEVITYQKMTQLVSYLKEVLDKSKIALNYGEDVLDPKGTTFADFINAGDYLALKKLSPKTNFVSAAPIIYNMRSIKASSELKDLRNVCKATLEILEEVPDWVKIGITEKELKAKIEYEFMKQGKVSFDTIVGMNENSADPHHNSSEKKLEEGVLLIDCGMQIDEMSSDITWTYWIGNNPPEKFKKAYKTLYEAKKVANKYYIDGEKNITAANECRKYLEEKGYDHQKLFFHGLGHSLGFVAHDIGMRISHNVAEEYRLKENMIYTNEPGLYWQAEWGIRLEDDVIIGKDKCEQVTYNHEEPILI